MSKRKGLSNLLTKNNIKLEDFQFQFLRTRANLGQLQTLKLPKLCHKMAVSRQGFAIFHLIYLMALWHHQLSFFFLHNIYQRKQGDCLEEKVFLY